MGRNEALVKAKKNHIKKWLSTADVAELIGRNRRFVNAEIAAGRMRAATRRGICRPFFVSIEEVERWSNEEFVELKR